MADQKKVKAVWWNDPNKTREFTEVGLSYVTNERGWIMATDQTPAPQVQKKTVVPAVNHAAQVAAHNAQELEKARANYKAVTGVDAPKEWAEPKLFIETAKATKLKQSAPAVQEVVEIETEPGTADDLPKEEVAEKVTEEKPKRKYTKKEGSYDKKGKAEAKV